MPMGCCGCGWWARRHRPTALPRMPAQPGVDTLTVAFPLSSTALRDIGTVVVTGGTNAVSLGV